MNPKKRIGEMLMEAGIIDETQLKAALGHQRQWGVRLGQALVDLKMATEADVVGALSVKFGVGVAELGALEPYALEQALKLLPREFAVRNNVFPMAADTASITVAMSDPTNLAVVDEIRFRTGRKVKVCVGGDREVADALHRHYPGEAPVEAIALDLDADDAEGEAVFDPFGGGSKDALEAFFAAPADVSAAVDALSAEPPPGEPPAPRTTAPPTAHARPAPARPTGPAAAPPAPAPAPAPRLTPAPAPRPSLAPAAAGAAVAAPAVPAAAPPSRLTPAPGPRAAPAPAAPQAPSAHAPPAPAPAPKAAAPAPAKARPAAPQRRLELELEELTPGPGGAAPVAGQETTGTAEFTLTDEVTGSGLLIPDEGTPAPAPASRALTARELEVLHALERLAGGAHAEPEILKPAQAMAALALLLVKKGIVSEQELLGALAKR
ncbi:MAG TPA: hypothetical protein VFL83_12730 [Anaeromyxobacter sp.]|nr:hypothetical protein [Anaeromyxobacter sp.]